MSRYALFTDNDDLEIFTGFDEGFEKFFLTIADVRICSDEDPDSYLFHNMAHHPGVGMTLDEVTFVLARFGITLPPGLRQQLADDARRCGAAMVSVIGARTAQVTITPMTFDRGRSSSTLHHASCNPPCS